MKLIDRMKMGLVNWALRANILTIQPFGFADMSTRTWRYHDYITNGYKLNPVVYACLNKIADALSSIPLHLASKGNRLEPDAIPSNVQPLVDLLKRPNPHQAWSEWVGLYSNMLHLAGTAPMWPVGIGTSEFAGTIRSLTAGRLYWIDPSIVTTHHTPLEITGYTVRWPSDTWQLSPEEMLVLRLTDPGDQFAGLSALSACAYSVDAHNAALKWNLGVLENSGVPAGVLTVKRKANLEPHERKQIKKEFQDEYMGSDNAGSVVVIAGEASSYQQLGQNAKDMDWSSGKLSSMREICEALGVPSSLVGDPSTRTFSNMEAAERHFYESKVVPMLAHLIGELNAFLVPMFGLADVTIEMDTSGISSLADNANEKVDRLAKSDWLTPNEKRIACGYDEHPDSDANDLYLLLKGKADTPLDDPALDAARMLLTPQLRALPAPLTLSDRLNVLFARGELVGTVPTFDAPEGSLYPTLQARAAKIGQHDAMRERHWAAYRAAINRYWAGQSARLVAKLPQIRAMTRADVQRKLVQMRADGLPPIFDPAIEAEAYIDDVANIEGGILIEFGQAAIDELVAAGLVFDDEVPAMQQWLTEGLAQRSTLINDTTAAEINEILQANVGQSHIDVGKQIEEFYRSDKMSRSRATTIARTEVGRADTMATKQGYAQTGQHLGVEIREEWLSARDGTVRSFEDGNYDHTTMDGQLSEAGYFDASPGGWAGSTSGPLLDGPAGFNINCRCALAPILPGQAKI